MSFRVLHPGTFSLLVDGGRPATRSLGVPVGGAADRAAFVIANALIGNDPGTAALEVTLSGPTLVAEHGTSACLFGAPFRITIDGRESPPGAVFNVPAGATLRVGGSPSGTRAYLAVTGGFRSKTVLGSTTAFAPLASGDVLGCDAARTGARSLPFADAASLLDESSTNGRFRVVDGPQHTWFDRRSFFEKSYVVSPASNRMGIRLRGRPLERPRGEMVSEPVSPGAIQITNDGLPIVLGVDGQTIGGYPKIAHVIYADLDRVAQLRPGDQVRFVGITAEQAESAAKGRRLRLRRWLTALRLSSM